MSFAELSERVQRREADKEKMKNVVYQLACLKELLAAINCQPDKLEQLKKVMEADYPFLCKYLPSIETCNIRLVFDSQKKVTFVLRPLSKGYSTGYDENVALYSAAIYQKVKEYIEEMSDEEFIEVENQRDEALERSLLNSSFLLQPSGNGGSTGGNDNATVNVAEDNQESSPSKRPRIVNSGSSSATTSSSSTYTDAQKIAIFQSEAEYIAAKMSQSFDCPICSKAFKKVSMTDHCNAHLTKKPWHCERPGCHFVTTFKKDGLKHVEKAHNIPKAEANDFIKYYI